MSRKQKFMTIGQIDATGVTGPHEKELREICVRKAPIFRMMDIDIIENIIIKDLNGKLENIGFDEDWTITLEFFPQIKLHILYYDYGNEFDDIKDELKILFSGERAYWIPGEDLATYIEIIMDFIEKRSKSLTSLNQNYKKKTNLMRKIIEQRKIAFKFIKEIDIKDFTQYLNAKVWKTTSGMRIKKEIFPEIFIEIIYDSVKYELDISYSGSKLINISHYHIELIGTFLINHILRYIVINNQDKELPDICYMMFSRLFTKEKGWYYRRK